MHETPWKQLNIRYPGPQPRGREDQAIGHLARILPRAEADGLITSWFFIRKGAWRIRYLTAQDTDGQYDTTTDRPHALLTDGVRWTADIYEPEVHAFGGPASMNGRPRAVPPRQQPPAVVPRHQPDRPARTLPRAVHGAHAHRRTRLQRARRCLGTDRRAALGLRQPAVGPAGLGLLHRRRPPSPRRRSPRRPPRQLARRVRGRGRNAPEAPRRGPAYPLDTCHHRTTRDLPLEPARPPRPRTGHPRDCRPASRPRSRPSP